MESEYGFIIEKDATLVHSDEYYPVYQIENLYYVAEGYTYMFNIEYLKCKTPFNDLNEAIGYSGDLNRYEPEVEEI